MTRLARRCFPLALLLAATLACAPRPALAQGSYSAAQLDQMLAPIALYPDALLSQVLMAATYPAEVAAAASWSRAHPDLQGDDAVRAAADQDWDPSVTSLLAFPQVLERMAQDPAWTQAVGDAFLMQQAEVMQRVQALRRRAQASGSLYSDDHMIAVDEGGVIALAPTTPQVVYVPYYDPRLVYGAWLWPAYPPVVWAPWPGYALLRRPGLHISFYWGAGIRIAANFFFGAPDWHRHRVDVVNVHAFYYRPRRADIRVRATPGPWRHEPRHRHGVEYRHPELQRRYAPRVPSPVPQRTAPRNAPQYAPRLSPQQREQLRHRETQRSAPQYAPRLSPQQREQLRRREMQRSAPQYAPRLSPQQREDLRRRETQRSAPQYAPRTAPRTAPRSTPQQRQRRTDDDRRKDRDSPR